jgi:hypothetical protein
MRSSLAWVAKLFNSIASHDEVLGSEGMVEDRGESCARGVDNAEAPGAKGIGMATYSGFSIPGERDFGFSAIEAQAVDKRLMGLLTDSHCPKTKSKEIKFLI